MEPARETTAAEAEILRAALHVFSRKGREGARMQEIADRAGINKAMLHYYFRSKNRLYDAVFEDVLSRFLASFSESIRDADTFEAALRSFIDAYIDFIRAHFDVARLVILDNLSGGAAVARFFERVMSSAEFAPPRFFIERMEEAIHRGELRPVDARHALLTVVSACVMPLVVAPMIRLLDDRIDADFEGFAEARKREVFDLVFNGLRA